MGDEIPHNRAYIENPRKRTELYREIKNTKALLDIARKSEDELKARLKEVKKRSSIHRARIRKLESRLKILDAQKLRKRGSKPKVDPTPDKVTIAQYRVLKVLEPFGVLLNKDVIKAIKPWSGDTKRVIEYLMLRGWVKMEGPPGLYRVRLLEPGRFAIKFAMANGISRTVVRGKSKQDLVREWDDNIKNRLEELNLETYTEGQYYANKRKKERSLVGITPRQRREDT